MVVQHCVVSLQVQDVEKQANWVNDYLTQPEAIPRILQTQSEHSDVGKRGRQGGVKQRHGTEKAKYFMYYHYLIKKIHIYMYVTANIIHSSSQNTHLCKDSKTCACTNMHTKKIRCHLAPETQLIIEAARKQCWGARSDRANRKQAAFCIPGQTAQHNTDTGRDTETDHLWPKTIHLPCSPQMGWVAVKRFFCSSRYSCCLW